MNVWFSINLIILVNLLFSWRTLSYDYVSDDLPVSAKTEPVPKTKWQTLWMHFRGHRYTNPRLAHWLTLGGHTLNCVLIYCGFGFNVGSLLAGLFFAVNPINTQGGSIWISGRPYSYATTCALAMFTLPWIAPLCYASTIFFSASAIFTPLPFLQTRFWFWVFLPLVGFGLMFKVVMKKWCLQDTRNKEMGAIAVRKLIPFFKSFGYYFRISLMPYHLGLYHPFLWGVGVNKKYNELAYKINKEFWIGVTIFFGSLIHIIFIRNMVSFGLMWYMVNVAMWCNFVTAQQQIAERYAYLPNVGLMIALAYAILPLPSPLNSIAITIVLTYYVTRLWYWRESYLNDYWHVEYNTIEMKDSHYAWVSKGVKKFFIGDFDGALRDFGEARLKVPHDFKQNYNMAAMFLALGDVTHCEEFLKYADESVYEGVENMQRSEFIDKLKECVVKAKRDGKLALQEIKIIK